NDIDSFVFEQNEKISTLKKTDEEKLVQARYSFFMQNMIQINDRSYIRLQDMLANLGGVVKALQLLGIIVNYLFEEYQKLFNTYNDFESRSITCNNDIRLYPVVKESSNTIKVSPFESAS